MKKLSNALFALILIVTGSTSATTSANAAEVSLLMLEGPIPVSVIQTLSEKQIGDRITRATAIPTTVDKATLIQARRDRGSFALPTANPKASRSPVSAPAAPNDAHIRYSRPLGGDGRPSLLVCRDWGASICASNSPRKYLPAGQTTSSWRAWPAGADGYHHPSNSCLTLAVGLGIGYEFRNTGWVKLSGLWGATWVVSMWCD